MCHFRDDSFVTTAGGVTTFAAIALRARLSSTLCAEFGDAMQLLVSDAVERVTQVKLPAATVAEQTAFVIVDFDTDVAVASSRVYVVEALFRRVHGYGSTV